MRKVAIFDIDGTIFRSSLLIELTDALIQKGIFSLKVKDVYKKAHLNWLDRNGSYDDYIWAVIKAYEKNIKGVDWNRFWAVAQKVVDFHKNRVYRYTRDLIKDLKKKDYYLLAISNSPWDIVQAFSKEMGFDKVYGRMYEIDGNERFTGKTNYSEIINDKEKILKRAIQKENLTLKGSIGVGDTEKDVPFLKMVDNPICFNPNSKLYQRAKKLGWKIVVERKDVIYYL